MSVLVHDLERNVYCVLGIPIDCVEMGNVIQRIESVILESKPLLIATPNVNFLVTAATDETFRETLIVSDLCPPDGMGLLWVTRLLGVPARSRVAGADILETLKSGRSADRPLKVFLFGGPAGAGAKASAAINARSDGLTCVGYLTPGYVSVEQLSDDNTIDTINRSGADFLLVALGSKKGQMWLHLNHRRLTVPVRAHLGATINFYAGAIRRAPRFIQKCGLEWAWRIKEEPALWRRYGHDAAYLAAFLVSNVLPLMAWSVWLKIRCAIAKPKFAISQTSKTTQRVVSLTGCLTAEHVDRAIEGLRSALSAGSDLVIDLTLADAIDARFAGLLLMIDKSQRVRGRGLQIVGATWFIEQLLRLYGLKIDAGMPTPNVESPNPVGIRLT